MHLFSSSARALFFLLVASICLQQDLFAADKATFISETILDGTIFNPGQSFTKTWTLRNSGTTTWNSNYRLRWVSGASLSNHQDVAVSGSVPPGSNYTFSVSMTAPNSQGSYREDWKLINAGGATINVGNSATIWVSIQVKPPPPPEDKAAFVSETIPDGTAFDAGQSFTKTWTLRNSGTTTWNSYSAVFVSNPGSGNASTNLQASGLSTVPLPNASPGQIVDLSISMRAPSVPGTYYSHWQLQNALGSRFGDQLRVKIVVREKEKRNQAPVALPGIDSTVTSNEIVNLDGSASYDPDGSPLSYLWKQISGHPIELQNANSPIARFRASQSAGVLVFRLEVSDGELSGTADLKIKVKVKNGAPTARAGQDQALATAALVTLDARNSSDPDQDRLTFNWGQVAGVTVNLSRTDEAVVTFTAPSVQSDSVLEFQVTVSDGEFSSSDSVKVLVKVIETNDPPKIVSIGSKYEGVFLQGFDLINPVDVKVKWNGQPGKVFYEVNGLPRVVDGNSVGVVLSFNMGRDFIPSPEVGKNLVRIWCENQAGKKSDVFRWQPVVLPIPDWLTVFQRFGPVEVVATKDAVTVNFSRVFPKEPLEATLSIPKFVPIIGGNKLGLPPSQAKFDASFSSKALGTALLFGQTGFEAAGKKIVGRLGGGGSFSFKPGLGITVNSILVDLGISGTIETRTGLLEVFPVLAPTAKLPGFGWINDRAVIVSEISPSIEVQLVLVPVSGDIDFKETDAKVGIGGKLALEVSVLSSLSASLYGGAEITLTLHFPKPYLKALDARVLAALTATAWWWEQRWEVDVPYYWPGEDKITLSLLSGRRNESFQTIPRKYLNYGPYSIQSITSSTPPGNKQIKFSRLISNIFSQSSPRIAVDKIGRKMILYVHDDLFDPPAQNTEINYVFFDGIRWTDVAPIVNDTRAEFNPSVVFTPSGEVLAVWERIKDESFSEPIVRLEDLGKFASRLEIVYAKYNPSTRRWDAPVEITNNNHLDHDARLLTNSAGQILLVWRSNQASKLSGDVSSPSNLFYSFWNGNSWNTPLIAVGNLFGEIRWDAFLGDSQAYILVEIDRDGRNETIQDREIYSSDFNGLSWSSLKRLTDNTVDDRSPRLIEVDKAPKIIWVREGKLVVADYENLGVFHRLTTREGDLSLDNFQVFRGPRSSVISWTNLDGKNPNLNFLYFSGQGWSQTGRLTEDPELESNVSGMVDSNGMLHVVYNKVELKEIVRQGIKVPEPQRGDLVYLEFRPFINLVVTATDLQVNTFNPSLGDELLIKAKVHNRGDLPAEGFRVALYRGGSKVAEKVVLRPLQGNQTIVFEFAVKYNGPSDYQFVVDPESVIPESDKNDNTAALYNLGRTAIPFIIEGEQVFSGLSIVNPSSEAETAELTFRDSDGLILSERSGAKQNELQLQGGSQEIKTALGIFNPSILGHTGWVELRSRTSGILPLVLVGSARDLDGSLATGRSYKEQTVPLLINDGNYETKIYIVNPNETVTNVLLIARDSTGREIIRQAKQLPPKARLIYEYKEQATGFLSISADVAVFAQGQYRNAENRFVLNGQGITEGAQKIVIPHFASGRSWFSHLILVNPGAAQIAARINLYSNGGTKLRESAVSIPSNGQLFKPVQEIFGLTAGPDQTGYITVEAAPGTRVLGGVVYGTTDGLSVAALPFEAKPSSEYIFAQVADGGGVWTGVAMQNPASETATVKVKTFRPTGEKVGEGLLQLKPGGKIARFIQEIVPESRGQIEGYIRLVSDQALYAFELFGSTAGTFLASVQGQSIFGTEPIRAPERLSGRWKATFDWTFSGCPIPPGSCTRCITEHSYFITQDGNSFSGVTADSQLAKITGTIKGVEITAILQEFYGLVCTRTFTLKGKIEGNQIKGTVSGKDDNCGTCKIDGSFVVTISNP